MKIIAWILSLLMVFVSVPPTVTEEAVKSAADVLESISFDSSADTDEVTLDAITEVSTWDGSSAVTPTYSSAEGAYIIDSAAKLRGFANAVTNGTTYQGSTVKLTVNINWNGKEWTKIGTGSDRAFRGTFDGNGCYVSNYKHTSPGDVSGFFGFLYGATVKNLVLKNITANNGNRYIGLFSGSSNGTTTIDNVDIQDSTFTATYRSTKSGRHGQSGVLFGVVDGGTLNIKNCDFTNVDASINDTRGGIIIGNAYSGATVNITNCTLNDAQYVSNDKDVGLAVGCAEGPINIDGLTVTGGSKVSGWENIGLVGYASTTCSAKNITLDGFTVNRVGANNAGGIFGTANGACTISNVNATNLVITTAESSHAGGLVGLANNGLTISNVNMTGTKITGSGTDNGGVAGYTKGLCSYTDITMNGLTLSGASTTMGGVVAYFNSGASTTFRRIILKGNISLTNTGGDKSGDILGQNDSNNPLYFYDINTKDAVITRNVSDKSYQGHLAGGSNGDVTISTQSYTYNELPALTNFNQGGYYVGGLIGNGEGKTVTINNTRINGAINVRAGKDSSNYENAGGLVGKAGTVNVNNVVVGGNITVQGSSYVGGIAGYLSGGYTVKNFNIGSNSISVTAYGECAGGLVGKQDGTGSTCTVSDLTLNKVVVSATGALAAGVCGYARGATTLTNFVIGYANVKSTGNIKVGGFFGSMDNKLTLTKCEITDGDIRGYQCVGGLIGYFNNSGQTLIIEECKNGADIASNRTDSSEVNGGIGGLIGETYRSSSTSISGSSNTGKIWSTSATSKVKYFGGLVGLAQTKLTISSSYNTGVVNGNSCNGGIIGHSNSDLTVQYCYNKGEVKANSSTMISSSYVQAGGIAGLITGAATIEYCFNRGYVRGYSSSAYYVGGIVGHLNNGSAVVQYCYNTGAVAYSTLTNTSYSSGYFRGTVAGKNTAGTIRYCYSDQGSASYLYGSNAGTVTGNNYVASANLKGSKYVSNTQLGTVYYTTDDTMKNNGYPILYWMGDPFKQNDEGVWEIWTVGHYSQFLSKVNTGTTFAGEKVRLMADVDLSTLESTTSIGGNGSKNYGFRGIFEGNNFSFLNFNLDNGSTSYTGFFGYVNGATIKDLTLDGFKIKGGQYTGGFVGYAEGSCTFTNLKIKNGISVSGGEDTGGVIGYSLNKLTLNGFTATGTIDVNCGQYSGGILGATPENIEFKNISLGAVDIDATSSYIGGVAGLIDGTAASSINKISATGEINVYTSSGSSIGGIVGRTDGNFTLGTANGDASSKSVLSNIVVTSANGQCIGGLFGNHSDSGAAHYIFNVKTGDVTVNGTGGYLSGAIAFSRNGVTINTLEMGNIRVNGTNGQSVGGIIGYAGGTVGIHNAYGANKAGTIYVKTTGKYVSGLVAEVGSSVGITGFTTGIITVDAGGGTDAAGYVANCSAMVSITGCTTPTVYVYGTGNTRGGLVGYANTSATISSSSLTNAYIGTSSYKAGGGAGGIVGYCNGKVSISSMNTNISTVYSSNENVGGAIGYCTGASITNTSLGTVSVTSGGNCKGGFIGKSAGNNAVTFTGSNSIGAITMNSAGSYVGMFIGSCEGMLTVSGQNATVPNNFTYVGSGDNNYSRIGAIAGYTNGANISGYAFGNITIGSETNRACNYNGGFVGECGSSFTLKNCSAESIKVYAASAYKSSGTFSHSSSVSYNGGIVGKVNGNADVNTLEIGSLTLTSEGTYAGGISGNVTGTTKLYNVSILGSLSSIVNKMPDTGGMIGYAAGAVTAENCVNHASVTFAECRAYNEEKASKLGGIIGTLGNSASTFKNCENYGTVTQSASNFNYTGGIVGATYGAVTFTDCANYGTISATGAHTGGILGGFSSNVAATFTNCTNTANVTGAECVGGICGRQYSSSGASTKLVNTGNITGTSYYVGGIFGAIDNDTDVRYAYNWGNVKGSASAVGGIVGRHNSSLSEVKDCYNKGTVSGTSNIGAISGELASGASIKNCYYLNSSCSYGAASAANSGAVASTAAQFSSGEIGWKLNGSSAAHSPYMQNLGTDAYPTFDGAQINRVVYSGEYTGTVYCNGSTTLPMYKENTNNYNCYHFVDSDGAEFTGKNIAKDYNVTVSFKHSYANPVVVPPTCTEDGYTESYCIGCGEKHTGDIVKAPGHQIKDTVVEPTCTADGYTEHRCIRNGCDYYVKDTPTKATGHNFVVVQKVEPTHDSQGYSVYECTKCGERYISDYVDAKGHTYVKTEVAATCTSGGYTLWTCTDCGDSYKTNETGALGHNYKEEVVAPNCTDQGYTLHTCSRCNDSYKDNFVAVDPDAHHWVTSKFDGTSHTFECTYCHKTRVEQHVKDMDGKCLCDEEFKDGAYKVDIVFNGDVICFKYMPVGRYFDFTSFSVPVKFRDPSYRVGHKTTLLPRGEYKDLQNGDTATYDARFDLTDYAAQTFNVSVVDKGVKTTTQYSWETKATAKAKGTGFLYWTDEYGNIVSTYKTYYFKVVKDTTLTAVYTTDVSSPTSEKAFIKTNFAEKGDDGSLTFYSERCVNYKSYKILSHGILFAPSSAVGNDYDSLYTSLVCSSGNSKILAYDKPVAEGETISKCYGQFTVAIPESYLTANGLGGELWYARAYVLVETADGKLEYHYGDIGEYDLSQEKAQFVRRTDVKNDNLLVQSAD